MLKVNKEFLLEKLQEKQAEIAPNAPSHFIEIIAESVSAALNIISRSDAMYHDVEHTCLVTLCGQEIFIGKKILEGNLSELDWLHYTISLLFHDIGYVKNILSTDKGLYQTINESGDTVRLDVGQTDASLTPHHIERGKIFLHERNWHNKVNKQKLMDLISFTQFPPPERPNPTGIEEKKFRVLAELVGSADLIGQLADPMYDEKIPRLYYEFKEAGTDVKLGYNSPQDLRDEFPGFYLNFVRPNINKALIYLQATEQGREWISGLNYHVFSQSHKDSIAQNGIALITDLANETRGPSDSEKSIQFVLEKICKHTGWPIGHAYKVYRDEETYKLKSTDIWHTEFNDENIDEFKNLTKKFVFLPGEGLPGRVYDKKSVQTIYDVAEDDNFPRAKIAKNLGVRGAFAFPIQNEEEVFFVLEFFSFSPEMLRPSVLELMRQVSIQISRWFDYND